MKCLPVVVFLLPFISTFSLHYDPETKTYNDLLISISPDLEGCKNKRKITLQRSVNRDSKRGDHTLPEDLDNGGRISVSCKSSSIDIFSEG